MAAGRSHRAHVDAHLCEREHGDGDGDEREVQKRRASSQAAHDGGPPVASEPAPVHQTEDNARQKNEHLSRSDDPQPFVGKPAEDRRQPRVVDDHARHRETAQPVDSIIASTRQPRVAELHDTDNGKPGARASAAAARGRDAKRFGRELFTQSRASKPSYTFRSSSYTADRDSRYRWRSIIVRGIDTRLCCSGRGR